MRYFRSTHDVYGLVCSTLDAAYGYPNAETKTDRTLPPVSELPQDSSGRVYVAISSEYCDYVLPSQMLPQLIGTGAVDEVSAQDYSSVLQTP